MNWESAIDYVGDKVIATDPLYGTYIGILEGLNKYIKEYHGIERAKVRILACIEYPSQKALLLDTIKRKKPFGYCEVENFDLGSVELYTGEVPDYEYSVQTSLEKAIKKATGKELQILQSYRKGVEVRA